MKIEVEKIIEENERLRKQIEILKDANSQLDKMSGKMAGLVFASKTLNDLVVKDTSLEVAEAFLKASAIIDREGDKIVKDSQELLGGIDK